MAATAASLLPLRRLRRRFVGPLLKRTDEVRHLHPERVSQLLDHDDGRGSHTSFKQPNVRRGNACRVGQVFLAPGGGVSFLAK